MGLIRFLLAVCVLAGHTGSLLGMQWMAGANAVVVFFIISGFYMALILNEKYIGNMGGYWLFISNRLLRLMPIYWTVLVSHLILCGIGFVWKHDALALQIYINNASTLPLYTWFLFVFCNLFIVGQDALYFVHFIPETGLIWSVNQGIPTSWFMPIIQAWTLSIELLFYIIAPFLLRKQKNIVGVFLFLFLLMILARYTGIDIGNFTKTQFAPFLIYFLFGALAWIIYKRIKAGNVSLAVCKIIFILYLASLFAFSYLYPENEIQIQSIYLLSLLAVPFIFQLTKNLKWDSYIGEYSYPLYITHNMVNDILKLSGLNPSNSAFINLMVSLLLSWMLIRFIAQPIERIRQARATREK